MGTVKWAAYTPESVNHAARERVKEWDMANRDAPTELHAKKKDTPAVAGIVFVVAMVVILVATYGLYF